MVVIEDLDIIALLDIVNIIGFTLIYVYIKIIYTQLRCESEYRINTGFLKV